MMKLTKGDVIVIALIVANVLIGGTLCSVLAIPSTISYALGFTSAWAFLFLLLFVFTKLNERKARRFWDDERD